MKISKNRKFLSIRINIKCRELLYQKQNYLFKNVKLNFFIFIKILESSFIKEISLLLLEEQLFESLIKKKLILQNKKKIQIASEEMASFSTENETKLLEIENFLANNSYLSGGYPFF